MEIQKQTVSDIYIYISVYNLQVTVHSSLIMYMYNILCTSYAYGDKVRGIQRNLFFLKTHNPFDKKPQVTEIRFRPQISLVMIEDVD